MIELKEKQFPFLGSKLKIYIIKMFIFNIRALGIQSLDHPITICAAS